MNYLITSMSFALKENVVNFVYNINAINHCLSHGIQLFQVR